MSHTRSTPTHGTVKGLTVAALLLALLFLVTSPTLAITYGVPDGDDHPFVGSMVVNDPERGLLQWCSGTLIAANVFLTASHCTAPLDDYLTANPGAELLVTFDPTISADGTFYTGTWYTNPQYNDWSGQGGLSDPGDVAVIILGSAPPGITPAKLPPAGLLDQLKDEHLLKDTRFTAVGYGTIRDSMKTGVNGILDNVDRNQVEQGFLSLTPAWVTMPMTLSTGNGGTCYGDSGGPHFIHLDGVETTIVASITVTGDAVCKATDKTYRMDTAAARSFLGMFVPLP